MRDAATLFASLAAAVAGTICGALGAMFDRAAAALRPPVVIDLVDVEARLAPFTCEDFPTSDDSAPTSRFFFTADDGVTVWYR